MRPVAELTLNPPVVLAIGGHDPCGGAGIQADIEAINANGGYPATLVTALTAQNTSQFAECVATEPQTLLRQAALLTDDMAARAIKLGLIPDASVGAALAGLLAGAAGIPIVLDPVMAAGAGGLNLGPEMAGALRSLLPLTTVVTPNTDEACALGETRDPDAGARRMLDLGAPFVLLTGTHGATDDVVNTLYSPTGRKRWHWPRLPHVYHGSGCTLAAALATWLARGADIDSAASIAQEYTWRSLRGGLQLGHGQFHPRRLAITPS
jgi:hydroxymethylpyrimidine/phosphomethylpyrimidine kinase